MQILLRLLFAFVLASFMSACSNQAMYGMIHEKQRQECLASGRADCTKADSYDDYQRDRDELLKK